MSLNCIKYGFFNKTLTVNCSLKVTRLGGVRLNGLGWDRSHVGRVLETVTKLEIIKEEWEF